MVVLSLILLIPRQLADVKNLKPDSLKWFLYSGVGVSLSQMFRYLALGIAPVIIVQPLNALSLVFRVIFGYFINRDHEEFDRYVITGIFISFTGVLALTISSDFILTYIGAPDWVHQLANWQWP
jgi:uncharacterized membrane protein